MKFRVIYTYAVVDAIEAQVAYFVTRQVPPDRIDHGSRGFTTA